MLLRGRDGSELELTIEGWQFPAESRDPWDANRLMVTVRVVAPHGAWQVSDPCLSTGEAVRLAGWLVAAAAGDRRAIADGLEEPNLTLEVLSEGPAPPAQPAPPAPPAQPAHPARDLRLRATLELETRPPWSTHHGVWVELDVSPAQLVAAAAALWRELEPYPRRGAR